MPRAHKAAMVAGALVMALFAGGCGGADETTAGPGEPAPTLTASASPTGGPDQTPTPSPVVSAAPSSTESPTEAPTTGDSADVTVRVDLVGGKPTQRPDPVVKVEQGQTVALVVSSDEAHEIHVHGFDKSAEIPAGGTETIEFVADLTGTWEVEIEDTGFKLFDLQVK